MLDVLFQHHADSPGSTTMIPTKHDAFSSRRESGCGTLIAFGLVESTLRIMDDSSHASQSYGAMDVLEDREWMREFHGYVDQLYSSNVYRLGS